MDFDSVIKKINYFTQLKTGWHYGEGDPVNKDVAKRAIDFCYGQAIRSDYLFDMDAFPGLEGDILVVVYDPEYKEIEFYPDDAIAATAEESARDNSV